MRSEVPQPGTQNRPVYQATAECLGKLLAEMSPGAYLPSEPKLAKRLGVSRSTLREALQPFVSRGVVVRRRGVGSFVARPATVIETGLEALAGIEALAARVGLRMEMANLIVARSRVEPDEASAFNLEDGEVLTEVSRVMRAQGRPIAYLVDRLPERCLAPEDVPAVFNGSVLELLIRRGKLRLGESRGEISALSASGEVALRLGLNGAEPLLYLEAWLHSGAGELVDHSRSYFLPETFRFHIVRRVAASPGSGA